MTSLDGINDRSIQTLLRGENDSKKSGEFQARQSLLLLMQGNIYNRLRFLNKCLMFSEEFNELFPENWSKFLPAGYLVFWKQFPAAGYLDTQYFESGIKI